LNGHGIEGELEVVECGDLLHLGITGGCKHFDGLGEVALVAVQTGLFNEPETRVWVSRAHGSEELLTLAARGANDLSAFVKVFGGGEDVDCTKESIVVGEQNET
jgi:hypothetical protein